MVPCVYQNTCWPPWTLSSISTHFRVHAGILALLTLHSKLLQLMGFYAYPLLISPYNPAIMAVCTLSLAHTFFLFSPSFLTLLLLLAPDQAQSTTSFFYSGFLQMFLTVPSLTSTVKTICFTTPWSSHVFSVYIWDWDSQFTHLQVCLCCDPTPMTQGQCFLLYNTYSIIFLLPLI